MFIRTVCISALLLSSCTKIPPVSSQYYLAKSSLRVDVTRTVSCRMLKIKEDQPGDQGNIMGEAEDETDESKTVANTAEANPDDKLDKEEPKEKIKNDPFDGEIEISISDAVTPVISNSADLEAPQLFDFQELRGPFTDPDVKVQYYSDGRLKGINTTQVGTAKQILESSIKVLASLSVGPGVPIVPDDTAENRRNACKFITDYKNKKTGVLVLQYSGGLPAEAANTKELEALGVSQFYHKQLYDLGILGEVQASRVGAARLRAPVISKPEEESSLLIARQMTMVLLEVREKKIDQTGQQIWSGTVLMALKGNEYGIPIPRRPAFGQQEFEIAFSEAGTLESIRYASQSGTADAIGLAGSVIDQIQGPTAAEQAKAIQAEADLIKQRQRLALCRANPVECE